MNPSFKLPFGSSIGSDHKISQKSPDFGGSLNQLILLISFTEWSSGEIPPCNAKNFPFIKALNGIVSNKSIKS